MLKRLIRTQFSPSVLRRHAPTLRQETLKVVVGVSAVSLLAIGTTLALDSGTHFYLENDLKGKKNIDPTTRRWGWENEADIWSVDPGLGRKGRRAVRNAWFSHHRPETYSPLDGNDEGAGDPSLLRTELPQTSPSTLIELLTRRASILERLGPSHLEESRAEYERVWRLLGGAGIQAARIAAKLGDVNNRLADGPGALAWWNRAIRLVGDNETEASVLTVPAVPPSSPAGQRILLSALVSVSAFYARARDLGQARKIEEASLNLLGSIRPPDSIASASPPQALHALSLLHRSAILSLHLAEVLYAQRVPVADCVQRLQAAATSSERVAYTLVGTSVRESDQLAPSAEQPLLAAYVDNPHLEKPASDLLRDARRSAADTWNLMGELTERMGPSHKPLALSYYTRAIFWAGRRNKKGILEPTDSTRRDDWMLIWRNYTRMRQAVEGVDASK
ncbi:hypothetical protein C8R43DRAFT_1125875 [Mycena crocata]|nr:hypothetical protein C8R43DRAFT_1125875 [Mycena crocata]